MKVLQDAVSEFQTNIREAEHPPCFSSQQFRNWSEAENYIHTMPFRKFVCRDCTSSYQEKMIKESRCIIPSVPVNIIARGV
jgi:hypothetical protein